MSDRELRLWRLASSALLRQIRVGTLVVIDGGRRRAFGSGPPDATINLRSPQFWRMLMRGSLGLAESYARGLWDSPDLVAVIRLAARNAVLIDRVRAWTTPLWSPYQRLRAALSRSTRQRSRRDVAAHYDLGNELFARMLDPTMMYSCALFEREGPPRRSPPSSTTTPWGACGAPGWAIG
jgi:cyclopropane-fatty-acyl-phospholipid synthase